VVAGQKPETPEEAVQQVVAGSRVIALHGYADLTLGHVSVRSPDGNSMFIKRKGVSLSRVTSDDVITVDLDDEDALAVPGMHLEAAMHVEAYRLRPDVGCVIHGHPLYVTALGATDARLEMVSHDSVLFVDGLGMYDESPDLITTLEQGRKVAETLGARRVTLLKNHGVMVVGEDVRWAVLAGLTLERSVRLQTIAQRLGNLRPISDGEAVTLFPEKYQDPFLDEYWEDWCTDPRLGLEAAGV
jgi:L-fuculose-phosphate aldolase